MITAPEPYGHNSRSGWPFYIIEVEPSDGFVKAWEPRYYYDMTAGGQLPELPPLRHEVKRETDPHQRDNPPRGYRLYTDGQPSYGGQWQSSPDDRRCLDRVISVMASYVLRQKTRIDQLIYEGKFSLDVPVVSLDEIGMMRLRLKDLVDRLDASEHLPKPHEFYRAIKNDGQGTGWRYSALGIGVEDLRKIGRLLDKVA